MVAFSSLLGQAWSAFADTADASLYTAMAIVTGTDMRSRPAGFARCLREVLVKVSGDPALTNDPRVTALAADATNLVAKFEYYDPKGGPHKDDQASYDRSNNLTVHFDETKINAALAQLGEHPWRDRPVLIAALAVHGGPPVWPGDFVLAEDAADGPAQRAALAAAAANYGVELKLPTGAELSEWGLRLDEPVPLISASDGSLIVTGTLDLRQEAMGWVGDWRARWHGKDIRWGIRGVGFDTAFDNLVAGAVRIASGHGTPN